MAYRAIAKGVVQGVGFRPFVYRVAKKKGVNGFVRNVGNSVEIFLDEGKDKAEDLLETIKKEHPPLAEIFSMDVRASKSEGYEDFFILESRGRGEGGSDIPPDVCLCDECMREIFDRGNRRYLYPFTVCTDCGPRFTIIEALPYDREKTTMKEFRMCGDCEREYLEPMDRRFRAEPTCCPTCGPKYALYEGSREVEARDPIREAARALDDGSIVAIKGVGGTHLATKTTEDDPILRIREILGRKEKPFAIMARDIDAVKTLAYVEEAEEELLQSFRRPIVILKKRDALSKYIAPGLHNIGVMLPYSGVHHLLFHYSKEPAFVMTSANLPGEPMAIEKNEILALKADYSLVHNRRIKNRCDDSVIKMVDGKPTFLRRSRGFVPQHIGISGENDLNILALGPELEVTACLLKGNDAFLSQYIGNTTKLNTLDYLEKAVYNLLELTRVKRIDAVAVDLHPSFNTSRLGKEMAEKFGAELVKCQHHHAHAASLMAEDDIDKMVCIAADGVGYGIDGTVWGGEVLVADSSGFERAGSLIPQIMPGGDLATRFPARMVAGILSKEYSSEELMGILSNHVGRGFRGKEEIEIVLRQMRRRFNTPETTSTGRVLDAISALLGVCYERTYEGEPAIKLEAFAFGGREDLEVPVVIKKIDGRYVLDTTSIIDAVVTLKEDHSPKDVAASAQRALSDGLAEMAARVARRKKMGTIGVSGGVAYNEAIVRNLRRKMEEGGFRLFTHAKVPCGDGGVSLGQACIAAENR